MSIPKLWALKKDEAKGPENVGGGVYRKGFVYSHVLTTYYNWKEKKLLKDKLDDMDALIAQHAEAIAGKLVTNTKFNEELAKYVTKAMMVGVDTNDENKVPNAAFIHSLAEKITANENAITTLNSEGQKMAKNLADSGFLWSLEEVNKADRTQLCIGKINDETARAVGIATDWQMVLCIPCVDYPMQMFISIRGDQTVYARWYFGAEYGWGSPKLLT